MVAEFDVASVENPANAEDELKVICAVVAAPKLSTNEIEVPELPDKLFQFAPVMRPGWSDADTVCVPAEKLTPMVVCAKTVEAPKQKSVAAKIDCNGRNRDK